VRRALDLAMLILWVFYCVVCKKKKKKNFYCLEGEGKSRVCVVEAVEGWKVGRLGLGRVVEG
jgi:hypothetical protein